MLLALVFRGVAFEFRFRDADHRTFWDHGFCYGSALGAFARGRARHLHPGIPSRRPPFRRPLARLPHAVLGADRRRADVRLRAARGRLAGSEDRRRASGDGAPSRARRLHRRARQPSSRQHLDAACRPRHRRALVLLAERRLPRAGSDCDRVVALAEWRALKIARKCCRLLGGLAVRAVLSRHRHQPLPDDRAVSFSRYGRPPRRATQAFLLVGVLVLLPVILLYTGWSYWVFRARCGPTSGIIEGRADLTVCAAADPEGLKRALERRRDAHRLGRRRLPALQAARKAYPIPCTVPRRPWSTAVVGFDPVGSLYAPKSCPSLSAEGC